MVKNAELFIQACNAKDIKHNDPRELSSGKTSVSLRVNGSAGNHYDVRFIFDTNEESVAVRVFGFTKADKTSMPRLLMACNQLNNKYRWLKFCIDDDMDLNIEADCVVSARTVGTVCIEMFYHFMGIAKEAYPVLMKAQFGQS